ncbi:type II toxin-antitoxin system Phd/YefM family antitoxin [Agromyces protaetiae]|uniref:Antitoxin n=1 Tax=Agromyces protaetiae TaxID=2509455 RepID=A0A4P6F8F5_9MICO|nr:type II toxin-antitoxin system Phd/YefM family antitoxin [Agromyces protaetiae]QAY72024.1 type II toxin-antitoxin system Phd/YefM family antitoxin [Agromyces protaetiae]
MSMLSSREFNNDVAGAKRRAAHEPVVITDRGEPAFVLMSMQEYRRLRAPKQNIVEALRMSEDIPFETPRVGIDLRVPEL